ncbi:MAG: tryptophan-rich sensory protein [Oscillospiraceae bacterium]|nr:tryptophan-rich sensory protein [Oscillospiraceae bacterium]
MKNRFSYVFLPLIALSAGGLSWLFSRQGLTQVYPLLQKSALTPPNWVFPLVWSVLYVLMGIGLAMVLQKKSPGTQSAGAIWLLQLAANFLWSPLFFRWQLLGAALVDLTVLWLLVLAMTIVFARGSRIAALLQIPYLLWLGFAGYLNYVVRQLNP